ncbi:Choline-sulfatase [Planctomycetes bacterium Poly30]|uniref:Choline-sulfatase n=1 Tax=Saltatorellus ferox TaxID=2528018 RepID=A0A518ESD1_9BACT|nr:Choline-sulfatase [Planctomycetes bacterium Poly30]
MTTTLQRLLILTGLALVGCGGDEDRDSSIVRQADAGSGPSIERLLVVSDHEGDPAPRLIAHYTPDDPERRWRRRKDEYLEFTETDGGAVVHVEAEGASNVGVIAPLPTRTFDRIDLDVRIPKGETELLRITLLENSRRALISGIESVTGTGEFERIEFPLPGIERLDVTISDVTVQVVGDATWTEIRSIDVLRQRAAALLPKPGSEPRLIDLGSDARLGWGLDPESGAIWRADRSFDGDPRRFRFSYATGPHLQGARLEVTGLAKEALVLDLGGDERLWKRLDRPVAPWKPGDEVRFRVMPSETGHDGPAALTELHLERAVAPSERSHAPLVLLITSDTHRGDHVGRGGTSGLVSTPRIDDLGRRGVQFTNAFASANMTNPSHVALMTGESPRDTRIVGNQAPLDEAAVTLAERFVAAGWATAAAVSVHHICHPFSGLGQGFDRYDGPEVRADYRNQRRPGAVAVERALAWMEERDDVPLFLWVHVFDVHGPYEAEASFVERYSNSRGESVDPALDPVPSGPLPDWITSSAEKTAEVRGNHNLYRAAVDQVDELLGQLFVHPRAMASEGVVAFTADHGESFGRHQLWWTHHGLYRDQIHVPLILAGRGLPEGLQSAAPVEMISLGATLMDLAGLDASEHPAPTLDLTGERPSEPRFALGFSGHKAAIDHEGWLLILNLVKHNYDLGPRDFPKGGVELYHVETDPACERELSAVETQRTERMKKALIRWLNDARPAGYATVFNMSPEAVKRLQELGYGGMSESPNEGAWYTEDQ